MTAILAVGCGRGDDGNHHGVAAEAAMSVVG